MRKLLSSLFIFALIYIPTAVSANPLSTGTVDASLADQPLTTGVVQGTLWQKLQEWEEQKESFSIQRQSPFERLRQESGKDFITDKDIEEQIGVIKRQLTSLNNELAPSAHYSQVSVYHTTIELLSRIEHTSPFVWQMLSFFLAGDDEGIYRLPYDKEAFHTALDYLQAVLQARTIQEQDSTVKEYLQELLNRVKMLRNDPEGIVPLKLAEESPLKPVITPYLHSPQETISSQLHTFLADKIGKDLYSSLFPNSDTDSNAEKWLSLKETIISLDNEYRLLLFHLIEKEKEFGNILIADGFSPFPYAEFPGTCAREADFTFAVKFGCWCENENHWVEEVRPLQALNQNGVQLTENNRKFFFDTKDTMPASTCRPCYGVLQYEMNSYCGTNNLEGSMFWGAVVQ